METIFRKKSFFTKERIYFFLKIVSFAIVVFLKIQIRKGEETDTFLGIPEYYLNVALFFIFSNLVVDFARQSILYLYLKKAQFSGTRSGNFILGINRIASFISIVILVLTALSLFRIDLKGLFTSLSIFAAAIALLSKDYLANLINGLIIMFGEDISLEDYVEIGDKKGHVTNITFRNIHLVNDDEELVYIPNSIVANSLVTNFTKKLDTKAGIKFQLDRETFPNVKTLEEYLIHAFAPFNEFLRDQAPKLKILDIDGDSIQFKFQYKLKTPDLELEKKINRHLQFVLLDFPFVKKERGH